MRTTTLFAAGTRRAAGTAVAVSAAALLATACGPDVAGAGASPPAGTPSPTASAAATPGSSAGGAGASGGPSAAASSAGPGTASASSAPEVPPCPGSALEVSLRQADVRPQGTGTGAALVALANTSGTPCSLQGHPIVAGAAAGSPGKGRPLAVTPAGTAARVVLAPGAKGWIKLTFVQVQGEGDGYCVSGTEPVAYPTLVIGLPGAGAHQVALDDGVVAECEDTVTATAVTASVPT
ncbi:DUF4232 domain-containing protein [Streptomyces sp. NPDC048566]|uniref:DUF4232 domain-containing protein n=1 Tax=Streptomyces sp. NPDC048566 TaxID=3365569 RepID=UPI00371B3E4B